MILYLGNNLSKHGNTPSSIETLGILLGWRYSILRVSNKQNQLLRWLDMMFAIVRYNRTATVVLIDTYSSLGFYYALGAAFVCRCFSIPYVPILRGGNLKIRLQQNPGLARFVFGGAKILIAPSAYLLSTFREFGFNNIQYIPNSIELSAYTMVERKSVSPKMLWVRSFHKIYNPQMALEVLQRLSNKFPTASLCMVGPDRDSSLFQCQEYVRKNGLTGRVKFTGVLSKTEWHKLAGDYDIFVNTTNVDNTPISVIEGMALGLPVVSTNVGGVPYLITDNETGLLVEAGDVDAMVEKIVKLVEDSSSAHRLALCARQHVEAFDWDRVKHKWFTLLDAFEKPTDLK